MKKIETNVLRLLMQGPVLLDEAGAVSGRAVRQLAAAKLKPLAKLRIRLDVLDDPGDGEEWDEHRKTLGVGPVMCPVCEVNGIEPSECDFCKGKGMVPRAGWDEWYFAEKACHAFKPGCETTCDKLRCVHDAGRSSSYAFVLMLESSDDGRHWKAQGNSLDGFRVSRLCARPLALSRFLNLITDSVNALSFSDFDDEEA